MRSAGIMLSEVAFSNFPILFKNSGLDFFIIDYEHGAFDYSAMAGVLTVARLCGMRSIVRLPGNGRKDIVKLADMGADGFLLPMTNSPEDIARVVRYARYRPAGERGISTMRAHTRYAPPSDLKAYMQSANEGMRVYAQIETRAGLANAGAILSVQGVDGFFLGPNDLSDDFGCPGACGGRIESAIEELGRAARAANKTAGIITGNRAYLQRAKACGYEMYAVGSELNAVSDYCKSVAALIGG